jgi:hypothetical protein
MTIFPQALSNIAADKQLTIFFYYTIEQDRTSSNVMLKGGFVISEIDVLHGILTVFPSAFNRYKLFQFSRTVEYEPGSPG